MDSIVVQQFVGFVFGQTAQRAECNLLKMYNVYITFALQQRHRRQIGIHIYIE